MYNGLNALVTGAASGIGKRLAEHLVANGATVICADCNRVTGETVASSLNQDRPSDRPACYFLSVDVSKWDSVVDLFKQSEELLSHDGVVGKLDFVFPNAGVSAGTFPDSTGEPDISPIQVNLIGVIYTIQAAINHFRACRTPGRIVVTASQASLYPLPHEPIYTAAKHGLAGLVRATGLRVASEGILINAVGPGGTESGLVSAARAEEHKKQGWYVPKETILRAFDMFLAPDCALTGQFAGAVGDSVDLHEFPAPSANKRNPYTKLQDSD